MLVNLIAQGTTFGSPPVFRLSKWPRVTYPLSCVDSDILDPPRNGTMEPMRRSRVKDLLNLDQVGGDVLMQGWVKTKRSSKSVSFVQVSDGIVWLRLLA